MSGESNLFGEKTTGFTLKQHEAVGTRLRKIMQELQQLGQEITVVYGDAGEMAVRRADRALEEIRGFLDLQVFLEHPSRNGNANAAVYYPDGHQCRNAECGSCGNEGCPAAGKCTAGCGDRTDHNS